MKFTDSAHRRRFGAKYGPWSVVTGASEGIGRALAHNLSESGINVALVARRRPLLRALASDLTERHGVETRVIVADLSNGSGVDRVFSATSDLEVGLLAACAGFGTSGALIDAQVDNELDLLAVNCRAVLSLSHGFARRFVAQRRGGIVLMSSLLAFQGVPRASNYAATKAYVQTLAEGLRLELRPFGVDVLASAPGPVSTGFERRADMRMGKALEPDQVARATLRALGHRTTVRPGWLSKLLEYSMIGLPRFLRSKILALVMRGMTEHQQRPPHRAPHRS